MSTKNLKLVIIGLFLFVTGSARANPFTAQFLISPYLYTILGQQIAVSWQYTANTSLSKNPSLSLYQGGKLLQAMPATHDASLYTVILPLAGCGYGTNLTYQVDGQSAPVSIAEIPCASATSPVKFSFMADAQEGVDDDKRFADLMAMFPGVAIFNGGDLVQTGSDEGQWQAFFASMSSVGGTRILYPAVGNHEYRDGDDQVPFWSHYFKTAAHDEHYAFDMGSARVIVINSNFESDPSLKQGQLAWLESELQIPSQWKIVYYHHPGYSVGFFNSPLAPKKEWQTIQDYYIPLFEKYKVDVVMNGHTHIFETALKAGVHYLTVGPAGGKYGVYGGNDPYKLKCDITRSIINLEVAPDHLRALSTGIDGQILDDLMLTK